MTKFEAGGVKLLKVDKYPYDFNGNKGVTYKANVLMDGDFYKLKMSEETHDKLAKIVGDKTEVEGTLTLEMSFAKDMVVVKATDFVADEA